jgi:catechol 2,3-dioxygenase-like lactoylglutathione lyase family enzyme
MSMPLLTRVIPLLHMTNSAATEDFYVRQLGFRLAFAARTGDGTTDPCYLSVLREGVELHLSSHAGDAVLGGVVNVRTTNIDELHREFVNREVPIHVAPVDQTWGLREMYVRDPDGNTLRFQAIL